MSDGVFDIALEKRFTDSTEATAVTSADTLLIRDNETGVIFKLPISVLTTAIAAAAPVQSVAGKTGTVTLAKADVGLSNVDNTSDANKPVSTAQQTALDAKANTALQAWQTPTFLNSWVNNGGGYNNAGYYKDNFGVVHLRGLVKSGTMQTAVFTLPVGYRPTAREFFGTTCNNVHGDFYVDPDGSVVPWTGSNAWFSLDGATFRT